MKRILGLFLSSLSLSQAFDTNVRTRLFKIDTFYSYSGQLDSARGLYCGLHGAGHHCANQPGGPQQDAGADGGPQQEHHCHGELPQECNRGGGFSVMLLKSYAFICCTIYIKLFFCRF